MRHERERGRPDLDFPTTSQTYDPTMVQTYDDGVLETASGR